MVHDCCRLLACRGLFKVAEREVEAEVGVVSASWREVVLAMRDLPGPPFMLLLGAIAKISWSQRGKAVAVRNRVANAACAGPASAGWHVAPAHVAETLACGGSMLIGS
jgi:hypothetical protein